MFQLRQLTAVEDRFLDTLLFLTSIVIEQPEGIATQEHDSREVAGRKEGHKEINDVPHQLETGHRTKDNHHSC